MGIRTALTRRGLLGGVGVLTLAPAAPVRPADASVDRSAAQPEFVLELNATVVTTHATWWPVSGGTFAGPRIRGAVLPGGTLRIVPRHDALHEVEAQLTLRTDDHHVVALQGRGLWQADVGDAQRVSTVPDLIAPAGAHDWLNRAVLIGTLDASRLADGSLAVRIHRVA